LKFSIFKKLFVENGIGVVGDHSYNYIVLCLLQVKVCRLHILPQQRGRPAEVADGIVGLPQAQRGYPLQGAVAERDRELEGLLARRYGAVVVSRYPECISHPGQHPSQPGSIIERPGPGLGLAQ